MTCTNEAKIEVFFLAATERGSYCYCHAECRMWPASHEVGMMCLRVLSILYSGPTKLKKWYTQHVIGTVRVWLCLGESMCVIGVCL